MPTHVTPEKKPVSGAARKAQTPPVSSTSRAAARPAPTFNGAQPSTLLPSGGAAAPQVSAKVAVDEIDLSKGPLAIPTDVAESVKEGGDIDVKVRLPGLAQGEIKLRRRGSHFSSVQDQGVLLNHPALARLAAASPTVLALHVTDDVVTGWVSLGSPGSVKGGAHSLSEAIVKASDLLGWAGLSGISIPTFSNRFSDGGIDVRAERLAFTVGGFLSGIGSAALDNKALSFDGSAKVQIPGGSSGELQIKKDPAGVLAGRLDLQVNIGSVAGNVTATLTNGFVSIMGGVAYNGDRLSGKVTLVATDEVTARDITLKKPAGGGDVPIELPGPDKPVRPGKRAYCGWGQLTFRVTDWLAGTATVIVNSKGQATIIGEIAPPKEFILFEQKEWIKRIFKVEIRAGYGIPVVGQVALFANISLDAIAKVGPGKLYNIKLSGAYSTDPRVPKQLSIEGTLNISAFAGLRARAEAGLVVTIIAHDIKAGVGLDAIAGVRGYVEATPRIGMREPTPGKRQYYIQGHLEIAAQPVLGFSGDLFVEIETPWWSPLSDKRWTWPLFSLEYPLPGEFGIGADVDYVLGSKQWPKIEFGEVNFDSSKFLTDVMNDNADKGSGGEKKKPGEWQEGLGGGGPGGAKNKGGAGKKPGELGADSEPVGESLAFSDGKESHRLWFEEKPGAATLMVATKEQTVPERLTELRGQIKYLLTNDRATAELLIGKAQAQLPKVQDEAKQVAAMKEAERKAEEAYKKYGKDKGKTKGKKESRKDKNKKLKSDEGKLELVLKDLFSLMRMEDWKNITRLAIWSASLRGKAVSGQDQVEIVRGEKTARLHIAKGDTDIAIKAIELGELGKTLNPAGRQAAKATSAKIAPEIKSIEQVPIAGNKVQVRANAELMKIADRIPPEITKLGKSLKVANLAGATKVNKMEVWPVVFNVNVTPNPRYQKNFETEMETQLRNQQQSLNLLNVDTWVARIDTYKSKFRDVFDKLDDNARKAVAEEIRNKLVEIGPVAEKEAALVTAASQELEKFMTAMAKGNDFDKSKLTKGQQRRYYQLRRLKQEAEEVGPARDELKAFLDQHGDLTKLTKVEQDRFEKLTKKAKVVGRSGQEAEFAQLHAEGIKEILAEKAATKQWHGLHYWQRSRYALTHNPDQVAGGHGTIASLAPVKMPAKPDATANAADQQKYQDDLKAWEKYKDDLSKFIGQKWINSIIGGGWGSKIPSLKAEITSAANYNAPIYGLWRLNFKLDYAKK